MKDWPGLNGHAIWKGGDVKSGPGCLVPCNGAGIQNAPDCPVCKTGTLFWVNYKWICYDCMAIERKAVNG